LKTHAVPKRILWAKIKELSSIFNQKPTAKIRFNTLWLFPSISCPYTLLWEKSSTFWYVCKEIRFRTL